MATARWSCRCGTMRGTVAVWRGAGTHLTCYCDSCVRAQRHFGFDANALEGVGIFQTTPDRVTIETGEDQLRLARLTPNGLFRWYAACCNTQLGATVKTPRFPFFGMIVLNAEDPGAFGPVKAHVNRSDASGSVKHSGMFGVVLSMAKRAIGALQSGRWRQTPFFDIETREPVVEPEVLPKNAGRV